MARAMKTGAHTLKCTKEGLNTRAMWEREEKTPLGRQRSEVWPDPKELTCMAVIRAERVLSLSDSRLCGEKIL